MVANGIKSRDKVEFIAIQVWKLHILCATTFEHAIYQVTGVSCMWKLYICMDFGPGDTSKHVAGLSLGYTDMRVSSPFANCIEIQLASS